MIITKETSENGYKLSFSATVQINEDGEAYIFLPFECDLPMDTAVLADIEVVS